MRNKEASNPDDYVILPELISKEPLGPSVRRGDDEWFAIAKWVVFALIEAEEYGITQANVDKMKASTTRRVQRILGTVARTWASCLASTRSGRTARSRRSATTARSSSATSVRNPRFSCRAALNNLWNKGGIMYAPPIR